MGRRLTSLQDISDGVQRALRGRKLYWSGVRGIDSQALGDVPGVAGCHCLTMPSPHCADGLSYEQVNKVRVNLNTFRFGQDLVDLEWQERLHLVSRAGDCVLPYRTFPFYERGGSIGRGTLVVLGPDSRLLARLDNREWVESEIMKLGLGLLPWQYVSAHEQTPEGIASFKGPVVMRGPMSTGGSGYFLAQDGEEADNCRGRFGEARVALRTFEKEVLSLSVSAVVDNFENVSIHSPSIQLVGVLGLSESPFEYAGNDFGGFASVSRIHALDLELMVRRVGLWLGMQGFRGAFGIDAMVVRDELKFVELNPRLTGSLGGTSRIDQSAGRSTLALEQCAVHLGVALERRDRLIDEVAEGSILYFFNRESVPVVRSRAESIEGVAGLADLGVRVEPGGALGVVSSRGSLVGAGGLTDEGRALLRRVTCIHS